MEYDALSIQDTSSLYMLVGCLGVVCYLLIFVSYFLAPTIQAQHPAANLIIWHIGCGLMVSIGFIGENIVQRYSIESDSDIKYYHSKCQFFSIYNQFFLLGSGCWYLMLTVDLLVALVNPWMGYSCKSWCYHTFAWSISAISALSLYKARWYGMSSLNLCWVKRTSHSEDVNEANWILLFIPVLFFFVSSLCVVVFASFRFVRRQMDLTYRAKRRNLLQYYRYLLLYGIYWAVCGVLYYADYRLHFEGQHARHVQVVLGVTFGSYPFFILVVWVLNTELYQNFWNENSLSIAERGENILSTDHFSASLRKDLMRYTTAGIKCSIIDVPAHDKRSPLRKDRTSSIDRIVGASIAHIEEGDSSGLYNEKKRLATTVYNGEYRYYEKLGFTDYAPKIFQNIRELCGIDNEMYTQSFTDTLLERASEGKSGMLFYFTSDRKYLVKTMTKKEHSFLLKMLPLYHQYLLKQPNTLLCRFLGCHSMQLPVGWNKMFFIVMENVLSVGPVHERYDLKGNLSQSHFSHEPRRYKSLKNSSGMTETQPLLSRANSRTSLWYDTDFISRRSCLQVNSSTRANMLAQVTSDCRFLQQMGVMDYSCLLGIRNYENPMDKVLLDKLPRNAVVSEDRKKIYFLGFIDILQHYNFGWKLQNLVLSIIQDKRKITALPPPEYALRFLDFIHTYLLRDSTSNNVSYDNVTQFSRTDL